MHLALFFKDFAHWMKNKESCVGLHVAGFATAEVLRKQGYKVSVFPVKDNIDVFEALDNSDITHVVISAPWLSAYDLEQLIKHFNNIKFVILSHSNIGFLQADQDGVLLLRRYAELSLIYDNIQIAGNTPIFSSWFQAAYGFRTITLPNLYPINNPIFKEWRRTFPIKVGMFGAARVLKNFVTGAAATTLISAPIELHVIDGGEEDKDNVIKTVQSICQGTNVTLIAHKWQCWDDFIELVAQMDILLQPSFTESFNMVTADGISVGVPSVVSPSILWAPNAWKANPDNAFDIAAVMIQLLGKSSEEGRQALIRHDDVSLKHWDRFLES